MHEVNPYLELLDEYVNGTTKIRFKCLKDGYIFSAIPRNVLHGTGCPVCAGRAVAQGINDLCTTNPSIASLLHDKDDGLHVTYQTHKKLKFICPYCTCERICRPSKVLDKNGKFICNTCGDGISYPEKYFSSFLNELGIDYMYQLSRTTFEWIGNYLYDFYIPSKNMIVEVHGFQHYTNQNSWHQDINNTKENDKSKYELAISNGIKHYIVVDARKSTYEWMKNSIINSLSEYFDMSDVNWDMCASNANNSILIDICNDYDKFKNPDYLCEKYHLTYPTIRRYIREGSKINLVSYNDFQKTVKRIKGQKISNKIAKKLICIETGEIFESVSFVNRRYNIKLSNIKNIPKHYGLTWMYLDECKEYKITKTEQFNLEEYIKRYSYLNDIIHRLNVYDENMNYIKTYDSLSEIKDEGEYDISYIRESLLNHKKVYNKYWYYSFDPR